MLIEACVDTAGRALKAAQCGAGRIELCANLDIGGTTPDPDLLAEVLQAMHGTPNARATLNANGTLNARGTQAVHGTLNVRGTQAERGIPEVHGIPSAHGTLNASGIPNTHGTGVQVQVMIRPRGGDFHYTRDEQAVMLVDAAAVLALARSPGATVGLVTGALTDSGDVDKDFTAEFLAVAQGSDVTFHKAIDASRDLLASLDVLASLGVTRILTSGGQPRAADGAGVIADMVRRAGPDITVMAGGGVRPHNVVSLANATGVTEVHLRADQARLVAEVRSALAAGGHVQSALTAGGHGG